MDEDKICTVCDKPILAEESSRNVRKKGLETFIEKSRSRKDDKWKSWKNLNSTMLHDSCRKRYLSLSNNPATTIKKQKLSGSENVVANIVQAPPARAPLSTTHESEFDYSELCIVCKNPLERKNNIVRALNCEFSQETFLDYAKSKHAIDGISLSQRIHYLLKNPNFTGFYHAKCRHSHKELTVDPNDGVNKIIQKITSHIENSGENKFYLIDFRKIITENQSEINNYVLCKKLQEHYGDDILIVKHPGRQTVFFL